MYVTEKSEFQYVITKPMEIIALLNQVKNEERPYVFNRFANNLFLYVVANKKQYSTDLMASLMSVILSTSVKSVKEENIVKALLSLGGKEYDLVRDVMMNYLEQ